MGQNVKCLVMKVEFFYYGDEHTWSLLPALQSWRNDFREFKMGDNYAIVIRFLNKCVGINIKL